MAILSNRAEATLLIRNSPAAIWEAKNPVLNCGEFGYENDTGLLKIGNGITDWNNLNYINPPELINYIQKPSIFIAGNLASFAADGSLIDSGISASNSIVGIATNEIIGGVLSSNDDNSISINENTGKMTINRVSVFNLYVPNGDELILIGGTAQ